MKTIVATAALVVALASPAMSQQLQLMEPQPREAFAQSWQDPGQAFASETRNLRARSNNPAFDVYNTAGEYLGSDPDPHVRNQLRHDPPDRNDD